MEPPSAEWTFTLAGTEHRVAVAPPDPNLGWPKTFNSDGREHPIRIAFRRGRRFEFPFVVGSHPAVLIMSKGDPAPLWPAFKKMFSGGIQSVQDMRPWDYELVVDGRTVRNAPPATVSGLAAQASVGTDARLPMPERVTNATPKDDYDDAVESIGQAAALLSILTVIVGIVLTVPGPQDWWQGLLIGWAAPLAGVILAYPMLLLFAWLDPRRSRRLTGVLIAMAAIAGLAGTIAFMVVGFIA